MGGLITLTLIPGIVNAGVPAEALALQVLAGALATLENQSSQAWQVAQPSADSSLTFALTPLPGHCIAIEQYWELALALRQQPQVNDAWPSFDVQQDS
jgi:hypothetical protein